MALGMTAKEIESQVRIAHLRLAFVEAAGDLGCTEGEKLAALAELTTTYAKRIVEREEKP